VLTTLSKKAMPVTATVPRHYHDHARAVRLWPTLCRFLRVGRRSDDMFIIRGVNVFPRSRECAAASGRYSAALPDRPDREKSLDHMEVR